VHFRLGETPGHGCTGGTGANDQNVNWCGHVEGPAGSALRPVDGARGRLSTEPAMLRATSVTLICIVG
jgi:hypothetical protein